MVLLNVVASLSGFACWHGECKRGVGEVALCSFVDSKKMREIE
ncbi:hypothetical protein MNB_SUP05-SYMBIONT-7-360 [hydrothermal vent metagenome]|uniref:Uncharacterized protein n=1 Tax=hydrothermal vent metagenome TaxID=652676 RepID=A0A1W1E6V9_9ZZZZ